MKKTLPVYVEGKPAYNIIVANEFMTLLDETKAIKSESGIKICIVCDSNVAPLYAHEIRDIYRSYYEHVDVFEFPAGEQHKTTETVGDLYEFLIENKYDRRDMLAALGGGVTGDLCGFAAATYLRGIDFIQIPTTLLSQVDSSIGGKTGVDYLKYKNMVGAFYMPRLVHINTSVLDTLPKEQFSSGMAEVIKYGLIMRPDFITYLKIRHQDIESFDHDTLSEMILISCECKKRVVEDDPMEKGVRAILNFGHTVGHAIEKLSDYSLFHGHCVAIGMACACELSHSKGYLTKAEAEDVKKLIASFSLPTDAKELKLSPEDVLAATKNDKKMTGGHIRFIVLKDLGHADIDLSVTDEELLSAIGAVV